LFLQKTCLLTELMGCLRKILSLIYQLFFILNFYRLIGLRVRNPINLSLQQTDFFISRFSSRNGQKSKLTEYETCLWSYDFHALSFFLSFFFLPYMDINVWMFGQICQYSTQTGTWSEFYLQISSFRILHLKVLLKHKTKNIKAFYI